MAICLKGLRGLPFLARNIHTEHAKKAKKLPDPWDLATGLERWEAIQYAKGNIDPFFRLPVKRGPGTKDCPNIVPSPYDKRLVACLCNDDCNHFVYWWIHEGFPRRCYCNYWFVLERFQLPKIYEDE